MKQGAASKAQTVADSVRVLDPFKDLRQLWLGLEEEGLRRKVFQIITSDNVGSRHLRAGLTIFEPGEQCAPHNHPDSEEFNVAIKGSGLALDITAGTELDLQRKRLDIHSTGSRARPSEQRRRTAVASLVLRAAGRAADAIAPTTWDEKEEGPMNVMTPVKQRPITDDEKSYVHGLLARARKAQDIIKDYDQETVDRICRAIGWAAGNEATFTRIAQMGVDESGIGDREGRGAKRFKIQGVLRDALRQKSVGIIEEDPAKGIVKYAKPVGVIASLIPTTNPELTPPVTAIYALKARNAVIFSPHPRSRKTTFEMVEVMRKTLKKLGHPEDLLLCVERPSIPSTQELMAICDLTLATGGKPMVQAAYSSGNRPSEWEPATRQW